MENDAQLLLVLLAVRMQGTNAGAKLDVFKKLKPYLPQAVAQQFVQEEKVEITVVDKGKPKKKKEAVLNLTEAGNKYLEKHAGPEAQAAAVASQSRELQQQLQADRDFLRAEILAGVNGKSSGPDPSKEIKALASKLDELAQRFAKLEASMKPAGETDLLARIDAAFAALDQKLQTRLGVATAAKPLPSSKPASTLPLRAVLREAYETLCRFIEFDSGVVELPRLYHEARKALPSLSVHAFHQELEALWSQRVLELKVLNEVRSASEPDKAIRRGDNLYYFVFWPQS